MGNDVLWSDVTALDHAGRRASFRAASRAAATAAGDEGGGTGGGGGGGGGDARRALRRRLRTDATADARHVGSLGAAWAVAVLPGAAFGLGSVALLLHGALFDVGRRGGALRHGQWRGDNGGPGDDAVVPPPRPPPGPRAPPAWPRLED